MKPAILLYCWFVLSVYCMNAHRIIVRWYDGWIGFYYDHINDYLYIFLMPFVGIRINCRPVRRYFA